MASSVGVDFHEDIVLTLCHPNSCVQISTLEL